MAAIGYDELAARAHYPSAILKEAENGPYLPTLPILAAYVRACEGDVPEWEERWRHLAHETGGDPGLPVRSAGASPAAVAGARAGIGVAPPDVYDPERIRAALRGGYRRSDQANGNHQAKHGSGGSFSAAVSQVPDLAEREEAAGRGNVADSWSHDGGMSSDGQGDTSAWSHLADTGLESRSQGAESTSGEPADGELAWTEPTVTELMPDARDEEPARPEPSSGEPAWPAAEGGRAAREPADGGLTWPAAGIGPAADIGPAVREPAAAAPGPAAWDCAGQALPQRIRPGLSAASGSAAAPQARPESKPAEISVGSARPQTAPAEPSWRRQDRLYPLRLLLIVVVAALIGSGLVLLFR